MPPTVFFPNVTVKLVVNGEPRTITVDVRSSLLDLLREQLHLTGAKKGCNHGACGACTVLVNGRRALSCLGFAATCDGAEITTVEGLAKDENLHPLQIAFIEHEAFPFPENHQITEYRGEEGSRRQKSPISVVMNNAFIKCKHKSNEGAEWVAGESA